MLNIRRGVVWPFVMIFIKECLKDSGGLAPHQGQKVILSALSKERMQKTLSTFSNAMMDCYALSTHMILPWSHFQNSRIQGF